MSSRDVPKKLDKKDRKKKFFSLTGLPVNVLQKEVKEGKV